MDYAFTVERESDDLELEVTYHWESGEEDVGIPDGPEVDTITDGQGNFIELTDEEESRLLDKLAQIGPPEYSDPSDW